jgi:RNA polymerase sigma factor (sigma-70 family)
MGGYDVLESCWAQVYLIFIPKSELECLKTVNKMNKHPSYPLLYEKESAKTDNISEIIEILPEDMQEMMLHRYVHRMTLREIGKKYGCCAESVRRKIKKAVEILKTEYNTTDIGL